MAPHRHWAIRNYCAQGGATAYIGLNEVEFRTTTGGPNLTGSGTASTSQAAQAGSAAGAFNGVTGSLGIQWTGNYIPILLAYDFGASNDVEVNVVTIWPNSDAADRTPIFFTVESSDDGVDWTVEWIVQRQATYTAGVPVTFVRPSIPGAARYWALSATRPSSGFNNVVSIAEIELRDTIGGIDLIGAGTPLARNSAGGEGPELAVDGNISTVWASAQGRANWWAYDFGSGDEVEVAQVAVTSRSGLFYSQTPTSFFIAKSDDGENYQLLLTVAGLSWSEAQTQTFDLVNEITSDLELDYAIEEGDFTSDVVIDYAIEVDQLESDIEIDYLIESDPLSSDIEIDYHIPEFFESDLITNYELVETAPTRTTQIPIMLLIGSEEADRTTQIAVLVVALPEQETLTTQVAELVVVHTRPAPEPFDTINSTVGDGLIPEVPVVEKWNYLTVVTISDNGRERRNALRRMPSVSMEFNLYLLNSLDRYEVFNMLYKYQAQEITYPQYHYSSNVMPAAATDTRIYFDPAYTDIRVGERLAVYEKHTGQTWFTSEVVTIETDGAVIAEGLPRDIPEGSAICAGIVSRFPAPTSINIDTITGDVRLVLESTRDRDLTLDTGTDLLSFYDNRVVLDKVQLAGITDTLSQNVDWLDNGTSIPLGKAKWQSALMKGKRSYKFERYSGIHFWRQFVNYCNGRQKSFLLPNFSDDLPLMEVPELGAQTLYSYNTHADVYIRAMSYRYIRIETQNGVIYRKIGTRELTYDVNGFANGLKFDLNTPIGTNPGDNIIRRISFMFTVRLDSDIITLTHGEYDSLIEIEYKAVIV